MNLCMRVGTAHEAGVQHPRQHHVADEAAAAGEQRRIFEAQDTGAEMLRAHGERPLMRSGRQRYTERIALQSAAIVPSTTAQRLIRCSTRKKRMPPARMPPGRRSI